MHRGQIINAFQVKTSDRLLLTPAFSLSSGGRLDYEDLQILGEERYTMNGLDAIRLFGLRKPPSSSVPYTPTNADEED
ncbi:unnamed protein product [Schistosoma mattheei]|uniref:Uncharacterized protein n=1 Tax=Schistosoma mattheei TaxID=31246 RepID=A0A183NWN1_9TREM|nr:unnamed protein product [Schistosoma mattheei]